jgi:hypothetical protein
MPLKFSNKKLLIAVLVLAVVDIFFSVSLWQMDQYGATNLDGTHAEARSMKLLSGLLLGLLVSFPVFCTLLALLVALVMNKQLPYGTRVARALLIILLVVYAFFAMSASWQILFSVT